MGVSQIIYLKRIPIKQFWDTTISVNHHMTIIEHTIISFFVSRGRHVSPQGLKHRSFHQAQVPPSEISTGESFLLLNTGPG